MSFRRFRAFPSSASSGAAPRPSSTWPSIRNWGEGSALKVMRHADDADPCSRKRWSDEARAFARVRHPGVVALYQAIDSGAWLYLVLEYVPGGTLKGLLSGPISSTASAALMAKVATAVDRIHQAGLVHLDLKPSNVLLETNGDVPLDRAVPKVADFGVAQPQVEPRARPGLHRHHARRSLGRHAVLHGPGADFGAQVGPRPRRGCPCPGSDPLRARDRQAAVSGRHPRAYAGPRPRYRARLTPPDQPSRLAAPRNHHPEVSSERPEPTVPIGTRPRRRSGAIPGWASHSSTARLTRGTCLAVVPSPADRRRAGCGVSRDGSG